MGTVGAGWMASEYPSEEREVGYWDLFVCEGTLCLEVDVGDQGTREEERPGVHTRSVLKRAGEKATV